MAQNPEAERIGLCASAFEQNLSEEVSFCWQVGSVWEWEEGFVNLGASTRVLVAPVAGSLAFWERKSPPTTATLTPRGRGRPTVLPLGAAVCPPPLVFTGSLRTGLTSSCQVLNQNHNRPYPQPSHARSSMCCVSYLPHPSAPLMSHTGTAAHYMGGWGGLVLGPAGLEIQHSAL